MGNITISGFYDEISSKLSAQIGVMHELGETYMCPRNLDGKNIADYTLEEFEDKIYPVLKREGIKFSSIGSPIGKVGIDDEEGFEKQKRQLAELVKIAKLTECGYIRVFSFFYGDRDPDSCHDKVVKRMRELLSIVKGSGVKLLHENEKKIYGDVPERVMKLYRELDDEDLVLCFDASNYIQCDADPVAAFDALKDHVVYYHVKDCSSYKVEVPVGLGEGHYEYIIGRGALRVHYWRADKARLRGVHDPRTAYFQIRAPETRGQFRTLCGTCAPRSFQGVQAHRQEDGAGLFQVRVQKGSVPLAI